MYKAETADDIIEALDDYAKEMKVLPRSWDVEQLIEPQAPKASETSKDDELEEIEDRRMREASGLIRTGKLFGGLINDIKRKRPFYKSDLIDAFHPQCLSSFLFLYFACLAPIVAFGGLLGEATENRIATIESLVSGKEIFLNSSFAANINLKV